ncbi:MAG: hypothetical protein R6W73_06780 [Candidatus Saliniplasma sp.]
MAESTEKKREYLKKLADKIEESQLESPFFRKIEGQNHTHFGSVIKEIKDAEENTHLVKIRPPLFLLSGILSNISRKLSGMENLKILDNKRWKNREVDQLNNLHPDLFSQETEYENAFLVEKIQGEVAFEVLTSKDISNEDKIELIIKMIKGLKSIHHKDLYHGEPTTQNCILGDDGDIYWIDFEIEYHDDLSDLEKEARDLEQLTMSILGVFEDEGEIGMDDKELIEMIFELYGNNEVIFTFSNNPSLPLFGPHRVFQLSFVSVRRFYQVQINLIDYLREYSN